MGLAMHSANYSNTLICPAEDCQAVAHVPHKPNSIAALQYELLIGNPYKMTSDDILSAVAAKRKGIDPGGMDSFLAEYFSKGQPCFRASPLTKTHGWAIHSDNKGYVALLSPDGPQFFKLHQDEKVHKVNALRSKRA